MIEFGCLHILKDSKLLKQHNIYQTIKMYCYFSNAYAKACRSLEEVRIESDFWHWIAKFQIDFGNIILS